MTYKDQFVVEVKCRGKFLRVVDDVVRLPFGSEYSLFLKNLNSQRAAINISIDGQDVLDNSSLILNGNSSTELEGFLRGNQAKNKFKFINKTKEIQDYRGDKIDDGIIRVEFAFEKPGKKYILNEINDIHHHHHHHHRYDSPFKWNYDNWFTGDSTVKYNESSESSRGISFSSGETLCSSKQSVSNNVSNMTLNSLGVESSKPLDDEGITVKGSECNQEFMYSSIGDLEDSQVIIIRLKGEVKNQPIRTPITTKTKLKCTTCGKVSKSSYKFCPRCGTFLE